MKEGHYMIYRLSNSEFEIMRILWERRDCTAKDIASELYAKIGWSKTTTYTVLKSCMKKGLIIRSEPNFLCHALVSQNEIRKIETEKLINRLFHGSKDQLIAQIIGNECLTQKKIEQLKDFINQNRDK